MMSGQSSVDPGMRDNTASTSSTGSSAASSTSINASSISTNASSNPSNTSSIPSNTSSTASSTASSHPNTSTVSESSHNQSRSQADPNRLNRPTASSRARQGHQAAKSRPDPRNAAKTTVTKTVPVKTVPVTKTVPVKTVTVPVKTVTVPSRTGHPKARKAISTPTKEDVTLSDLTLDASCISSRAGSSQALDSTMVAPGPMQRPLAAGGGARASVRGRPSTGARMKLPLQPPVSRVAQAQAGKNSSRSREQEGEEEVAEELMEAAYTRYLQTAYVAMKSRDNVAVVEKKCESQLFQAFSATEELRQSVLQKQRDNAVWAALAKIRRSLGVVSGQLAPCLASLTSTEEKLARLAGGVARVQHHLLVQGVTVGEGQAAQEELESVSRQLEEFHLKAATYDMAVMERGPEVARLAAEYGRMADSYTSSLQLVKECHQLVKEAGCLVTQEGSLALSLAQLPKEDILAQLSMVGSLAQLPKEDSLVQLPGEGSLAQLPTSGEGETSGEDVRG